MVHGGAGTGKTNNLHSFLCIPFEYSKSTYNPLGLKELGKQRKVWNNVRVIVIDEISMVPALLGWVSMRLQQITNVQLPFGGFVAILMGDALQIPSIPQPTLAEAVLLCAARELSTRDMRPPCPNAIDFDAVENDGVAVGTFSQALESSELHRHSEACHKHA